MTSSQPGLFPTDVSCSPDGPARATPWQDIAGAWLIHEQRCGCTSPGCWLSYAPRGSSARTSLAFCRSPSAPDATSPESCGTWPTSGWSAPGGYWTLATSECPNDGAASSLSDILDPPGERL